MPRVGKKHASRHDLRCGNEVFHRCVGHVEQQGHSESASYAICTAGGAGTGGKESPYYSRGRGRGGKGGKKYSRKSR